MYNRNMKLNLSIPYQPCFSWSLPHLSKWQLHFSGCSNSPHLPSIKLKSSLTPPFISCLMSNQSASYFIITFGHLNSSYSYHAHRLLTKPLNGTPCFFPWPQTYILHKVAKGFLKNLWCIVSWPWYSYDQNPPMASWSPEGGPLNAIQSEHQLVLSTPCSALTLLHAFLFLKPKGHALTCASPLTAMLFCWIYT